MLINLLFRGSQVTLAGNSVSVDWTTGNRANEGTRERTPVHDAGSSSITDGPFSIDTDDSALQLGGVDGGTIGDFGHMSSLDFDPAPSHASSSIASAPGLEKHSPPSPSPASFLFDDTFCRNVMDKHVVLHFAPTYDGGKWQKRAAKTNLPSRFRGQQGDAGPNEVSVTWTNNQNTATLDRNVNAKYLLPAFPYKKGGSVLVLQGPHQSEVASVLTFSRKGTVKLECRGETWAQSTKDCCIIEDRA